MTHSLPIVHEGGLDFELYISEAELAAAVDSLAEQINHDYEGREPLFVCVLNGAFLFAADLFRRITLHSQMTFVRLCSYTGLGRSGEVREMMGLTNEEVKDRDIIVLEDIVDTGYSMHYFIQNLQQSGARSVAVCSCLFKPEALLCPDARPKYVGIEIRKRFILGYGMDLDGFGRNLPAVYVLSEA